MPLEIRKLVTYAENMLIEGGRGFVEDLHPEIRACAPFLGESPTGEILRMAGSGDAVEGYGKGRGGRHRRRGRSCLGAGSHAALRQPRPQGRGRQELSNPRGGPNSPIVIPLMHKHDAGMRSHYFTIQFSVLDAPVPDEIVIALGGSIGGRPHHRIADRYKDLEELGNTDV